MTSTADTHAGAAAGLPTCADIAAVRNFLRKCAPGWRGGVTRSTGVEVRGGLSEETDGEGKRKRIERTVDVEAVGLTLRHDDGRAVAIVWRREVGARTASDKPAGYGYAFGWHGRLDDELTPGPLSAKVAAAFVAAETLAEAREVLGRAPEIEAEPDLDDGLGDVREPVPHYQSRGWAA